MQMLQVCRCRPYHICSVKLSSEHTTDTGGGVNNMLTLIKHSRGFQPKARNQLICRILMFASQVILVAASWCHLIPENSAAAKFDRHYHHMLVAPNACMSSLSFELVLIWSTHISPITVMATSTVKMTMIRMM
ncbi:uncharacterized protein EI90DRAFT_3286552, partial [Cantharellus anzutake]|uniref:uncharacterized protein n=1 Tax=Cantharellus anzutake TaxID=1750568 RepID=UPI001905CFA7